MSINMDGDKDVSYSDHDVHHIRHRPRIVGNTGGDDVTEVIEDQFEITERGLDPDELAELRAMRVTVGIFATAGSPQDSRGELSFSVDAGYNLSSTEVIGSDDTATTEQLDPDNDATDELDVLTNDTDEVGQIYTLSDNVNIGFDDDANGNGGGGQNNVTSELLNMDELFGSGPYVDAADDFSSIIKFEPDNIIEFVGVDVRYSLYYDVMEVEGGRTRFGR